MDRYIKTKTGIFFFMLFLTKSFFANAQDVVIKTNLLYGGIMQAPNVGVEWGLSSQLTLDLWGAYNPFPLTFRQNRRSFPEMPGSTAAINTGGKKHSLQGRNKAEQNCRRTQDVPHIKKKAPQTSWRASFLCRWWGSNPHVLLAQGILSFYPHLPSGVIQ